jgi:hypothetical protein
MSEEIFEKVRESARRVMFLAQHVKVKPPKLEAFAASLNPADIRARYYYTEDFHFLDSGRPQLDYVFTVDAINFGSGFSPLWKAQRKGKSTYKGVASALKAYIEQGNSLNATFAAQTTPEQLAAIFNVTPDFEMVKMFANSLNQLGQFVVQEYEGEYANLLDSLPGPNTAAQLVELLTSRLSCFDDRAEYQGQPVYFYKRAQILVNDLYLAFNGVGFGDFPDISHLTVFADNLVPHLYRVEEALEYTPALAEKIENGNLLPSNSPEEIEIRAAAVYCVEETCRLVNQRSVPDDHIFPAELDVYLWNRAQDLRYKSRPRHLTRTYFY